MKTNEQITQSKFCIAGLTSQFPNANISKAKKFVRLAARIEQSLIEKGLSKKDFASLLNVQPSVVTKWLSGSHNFTIDTLFDIEKCLGVQLISVGHVSEPMPVKMAMIVSSQPIEMSSDPFWHRINFIESDSINGWTNMIDNSSTIFTPFTHIRKASKALNFINITRLKEVKEKHNER